MVSPIPAHSSEPMPIADLTVPPMRPPASVMPRCSGQSTSLGELHVGGDGEEHVAGLHRDLIIAEAVVLENADMVERAFDQRLRTGLAIFFEQVLFEAAGIDPDADRAAVGARRGDDFADPLLRADVAGVDAQAGGAGVGGFERALVVKVDVGDDRHVRGADDLLQRRRAVGVGQDTRMMSAPASSQRRIWAIVAAASSVGVLVMVWTLIGASPPTGTEPTMICRDLRRSISRQGRMDMAAHIGAEAARGKLACMLSACVSIV